MVSSDAADAAHSAYEVYLALLGRDPSAAECEQWATRHAGDPDEARALVAAGWLLARAGDTEQALELFRRAAALGGEHGRDAQVGIAEQLYAQGRDREADEAQRALRAELDDQPGGLSDLRVFEDMVEMLTDAGQNDLALDWCQEGLDRVAEADDSPEVEHHRRELLINHDVLLKAQDGGDDDELWTDHDGALAAALASVDQQFGGLRPDRALGAPPAGTAVDGIVVRWRREDFATARSRWPGSTGHHGDDYEAYAARIQGEARTWDGGGAARVRLVTASLADYETYAERAGRDPAEQATRQSYGQWCAATRPEAVQSWPPGRNSLCWCDSGRKYKRCCGAPPKN